LFVNEHGIILKLNSADVRSIYLDAQTLAKKQSSFKVFFITQIGHRPGASNSNCSRAKRGLIKKKQGRIMTTLGPHYDAGATKTLHEPF